MMSKQSGLGDALYVAGYDLSGDVGSIGRVGGGPNPLEITGIDVEGMERLGGVRDGSLEWSSWFNPDRAHPVLSVLPTSDVIVTYCRGTALGSPAASLVSKQIGYDGTRGEDGSFSFELQAQANGFGLEWGRLLTAGVVEHTEADEEASVDGGAASSFGLQAYLHVMEFTGTDVTIKLQQSSDDGGTDAWADVTGGAFSEVTAGPTAERIATASGQAVERYLRVVTVTDAGFSSLAFAVAVVRNEQAVSF